MKKIAKLSSNKKYIETIIDYDPIVNGQLIELYNKQDFALLVDLTGFNPMPLVGWYYDGNEFYDPLGDIEKSMHDYIDSHYSPEWRAYLQMEYGNEDSSNDRKEAARSAGLWVKSIVEGHFKNLVIKSISGQEITIEDIDWPTLFDDTDPHINILTLPE